MRHTDEGLGQDLSCHVRRKWDVLPFSKTGERLIASSFL